jgi:SAM-dependent methyltransferase
MRAEGQRRHLDPRIRRIPDRLPGLEQTFRLGLSFDFILLSAVWMHVPPTDRSQAFRKLVTLLKPGGFLAITLRNALLEAGHDMYPVWRDELERLEARPRGLIYHRRGCRDCRYRSRWSRKIGSKLRHPTLRAHPYLREDWRSVGCSAYSDGFTAQ